MPGTSTTPKVDLKQVHKPLWTATAKPTLIDVPPLTYLMIDGHGNPNTAPEYADAVQTLYTVAYTAKFALKKSGGPDVVVMPLEGLWWAPDLSAFTAGDKDAWDWTMMITAPDAFTPDVVEAARAAASSKAPAATLAKLRLEPYAEGRAAQILHVGPYADEGPTIERLHAFIADQGMQRAGKHHEIYLGDPRRTAPEKLKTIIRQPVGRGAGG
jgi:hypothetical protein